MSRTRVEVFCGTGGVGKTTLAASRAFSLADKENVLLITIDPSRRLKQVLKVEDSSSREPQKAKLGASHIWALLMSPNSTVEEIGKRAQVPEFSKNKIVKILGRPNGGLNEILALVELNFQLESQEYDVIVLDTPPGSHFLDFLGSAEKIRSFFDKKFVEVFSYVSETTLGKSAGSLTSKILSGGIRTLMSQLEKVTGASFVKDFVQAIAVIYQTKDVFIAGLKFKDQLINSQDSEIFLVTSTDQNKSKEALEIKSKSNDLFQKHGVVAINKSLKDEIEDWNPDNELDKVLKNELLDKEQRLQTNMKQSFKKVLLFPEIISSDVTVHMNQLTKSWIDKGINHE